MNESPAQAEDLRAMPRRIFNVFRLIIAGLLLVAGLEIGLGAERPAWFLVFAGSYFGFALISGFPFALEKLGAIRLTFIQFNCDILALTAVIWVSGGHDSGIAGLMMVYIAAVGVLGEGRVPLYFAALATVGILVENAWRYLTLDGGADFLRVGFVCIGFFAIATTTRLLAARARTHESLAEERGEALDRQQAINERIIEDMQDGVLVFDAAGRLRQLNPHASQLLGAEMKPGEPVPELDAVVARCRVQPAPVEGVQLRLGEHGKLVRCRAVHASLDDDGAGDVVVYLTDFEEIQKQIQEHKLAALGRLTASMAHEIRNPLTAVTQAADLLGEEKRAEVQERLVRIIRDNSRRIERMVRDVLALGRRDEVVREALPLAPALAGIVEELTLAGAAERAVFTLDVPAEATLLIDRAHLHQIVVNLLANARRVCSGKPGAVAIRAAELPGGQMALHIRDDGPGVDVVRRETVFEPFYTTDPKGTGLGLYIARELADANGARLELAPDGPGAHFVLSGRSRP